MKITMKLRQRPVFKENLHLRRLRAQGWPECAGRYLRTHSDPQEVRHPLVSESLSRSLRQEQRESLHTDPSDDVLPQGAHGLSDKHDTLPAPPHQIPSKRNSTSFFFFF